MGALCKKSYDEKKTLKKRLKGVKEGSIYAAGRCTQLEKLKQRKIFDNGNNREEKIVDITQNVKKSMEIKYSERKKFTG